MDTTTEQLYFEPVTTENFPSILPLAERIWQNTYTSIISQEQITYMLPMMYGKERVFAEIADGYVWELLKEQDELLGYLDYKLMSDNRVFLSKIYLDPEKQKKGLGKWMLDHVVEYARQKGADSVYLTVNKFNAKAIAFYERNGMKCIEEKAFDIGNDYIMDDYIYQLDLKK